MATTKSRRSKKVRARLEQAASDTVAVRVSRRIKGSDRLEGFVVGIGRAWLLLAVLDPDTHLNGYAAVRLADVSKVKLRAGVDGLAGRALAARGQWPPAGVALPLDEAAGLVRTAAEVAPLVGLLTEEDDPNAIVIGRPVRLGKRSVRLLEIDPDARWAGEPSRWAYADVTRVDLLDRYQEALALVGGPPPAAPDAPPASLEAPVPPEQPPALPGPAPELPGPAPELPGPPPALPGPAPELPGSDRS
jgi:hypothetical protein